MSTKTGRVDIQILFDSITYQNISTYFRYDIAPEVESCWPPFGPTRGGTTLSIKGRYLNDQVVCVFNGQLKILPVRVYPTHVVCQMPAHYPTPPLTLSLELWGG